MEASQKRQAEPFKGTVCKISGDLLASCGGDGTLQPAETSPG